MNNTALSFNEQESSSSNQEDAMNWDHNVDAIVSGQYDIVRSMASDPNDSMKKLGRELQGQSFNSMRLLASVTTSLSELMTLSAWTNGNAQKFSHETTTVSAAVEELVATSRSIAEGSNTAREQTSEIKSLVSGCVERVSTAERSMSDISESFDSLNERLQSLDGAIESIGGFAKDIEAISNQTKLLALNATIEAARAGEAGKGFAVVASEVKSLSEQTSKTTEMIAKQLSELDNVMTAMIESMTNGGATVREGAESFGQVVSDIDQIRGFIDTTDAEIQSMSDALGVQNDTIESVAKNIEEIAGLAKNNTDDSVNSINLIRETEKKVSEQLATYASASLPNQAVWRLRADHTAWKQALAECLVGLKQASSLDKTALSQPFGSWLARVDGSMANSSSHSALVELERELRNIGEGIVQNIMGNNFGEAIGAFFGMEEKSNEALNHIGQMEKMAG